MRMCDLPVPWFADPDTPGAGQVAFFLVTGTSVGVESTLGIDSQGNVRPNANPCGGVGEEALCLATGGVWDPISCGHYNCGQFPDCDAIIPGCNCGPGRNFENGVGCVDDPDCP